MLSTVAGSSSPSRLERILSGRKLPLNKWPMAANMSCSSKKGISAHQLLRMLRVTFKTAWLMAHRTREAMKDGDNGLLGSGRRAVGADETFWGNHMPRGASRKRRGYAHKMKALSLAKGAGKRRAGGDPPDQRQVEYASAGADITR